MQQRKSEFFSSGFSLTELLIALGILGVIAAFTIPKVLQTQQNQRWNAEAKQVMLMVQSAYNAYEMDVGVSASTRVSDFTPYFNYIKKDTVATQTIDHITSQTSLACASNSPCLRLPGGGTFYYDSSINFGSGSSTNYVYYVYDPDGTYSGTTNGPGKALWLSMYYDGRVGTGGNNAATDVTCGGSCHVGWGGTDPDWYQP